MKVSFHKDARAAWFDQSGNPLSTEQVQDFVAIAYARIGLIFSGEELKSEADGWYVGVDDNDPDKFHWFICYKNTPFGRKFFATGHDGTPEAKKELGQFKKEVMFDRSLHCWGEASGRIEELYKQWGLPKIPFEVVKTLLPGKQLEQVDEYSYKRSIGGNPMVKTVYGFPRVPAWQSQLLVASEGKGFARITKS